MNPRHLIASLTLAPSAAVFLLIFVAPLSYFFVLSFWRVQAYQLERALSLTNYATVFTEYAGTLGYTFSMVRPVRVFHL